MFFCFEECGKKKKREREDSGELKTEERKSKSCEAKVTTEYTEGIFPSATLTYRGDCVLLQLSVFN